MRLLILVNFCLIFCIFLVLTLLSSFVFKEAEVKDPFILPAPLKELPASPFRLSPDCYKKIGEGSLSLHTVAPKIELPDLREEISFFGKCERPDLCSPLFYMGLLTSNEKKSVPANERVYLLYQRIHNKGNYTFSPENEKTNLWFELKEVASGVEITLNLLDDRGKAVVEPTERYQFTLSQKEEDRSSLLREWEIGGFRVDASFLGRQQARWYGADCFLEIHGGPEFEEALSRQRIDFPSEKGPYFVFVKEGDFLIWKDEKWVLAKGDEETFGFPLLILKKQEERMMTFELWSGDGKVKILMNLLRNRGGENFPEMDLEFKFLGAKTFAQFIVECRSKRLILRPNDWLVLLDEGWKLLETPDEIDAFVNRQLEGPLFVLDKVIRKEGKQIMVGHLFNHARNESREVELLAAKILGSEKVAAMQEVVK